MKAIHAVLPDFVPQPIAQGVYALDPDINFFLMKFVDMTNEVPEVESLPKKVAEMHRKCISPTGKFGFHVPTNEGALQQPNVWMDSWEKFFSDLLQRCFDWEQQIHGENGEMQYLFKQIIDKVIPRLIRPLETGGNKIQPRLVHGDLWDGKPSTDAATQKPLIFDASSMYAHNECILIVCLLTCVLC
jgi:fructosamine-3-kinase